MDMTELQLNAINCCKQIYLEWEEREVHTMKQAMRDAWECGKNLVEPPNNDGRHVLEGVAYTMHHIDSEKVTFIRCR